MLLSPPAQDERDQEAAIAESTEIDPSYHGHIRDDARTCWISFPGKYAAGLTARRFRGVSFSESAGFEASGSGLRGGGFEPSPAPKLP